MGECELQECEKKAIDMKRAGDIQGALAAMRERKGIVAEIEEIKQNMTSANSEATSSPSYLRPKNTETKREEEPRVKSGSLPPRPAQTPAQPRTPSSAVGNANRRVSEPTKRHTSTAAEGHELDAQIAATKAKALDLKHKGDIQGALMVMKELKILQKQKESSGVKKSANDNVVDAQPSVVIDPAYAQRKEAFLKIEKLLVEFANDAGSAAKDALAEGNREKAVLMKNKRERYANELAKMREIVKTNEKLLHNSLASGKPVAYQDPPLYSVEESLEKVEKSNPDTDE